MVKNTGATTRPHHLRALNEPRPITVVVQEGLPIAIVEEQDHQTVALVQNTWIVQDEWWRQEIHRQYYRLLLNNGSLRTVYHDRVTDIWHEQSY
jgi:hypothetical protein